MEDEILERAEAELMRAREADVLMLAAEAEGEVEEEEDGGMDADLDEGVPEAEEEGEGWTEEEEEEEVGYGVEEEDGGEDGEEGGIEGLGMFEGEGDYGSPPPPAPPRRGGPQQRYDNTTTTGAAVPLSEWATLTPAGHVVSPRTPVAAGMGTPMSVMMSEGGGDLDAAVPEAGDYEHTDTEVEDASTDDDDGWAAAEGSHGHAAVVAQSSAMAREDAMARYMARSGGVVAPSSRAAETGSFEGGQQRGQRSEQGLSHHPQRESARRERRSERQRNAYQTPSFDAGLGSSSFDGGSGLGIGEDSLLGGSVFGSSPLTVSMGGYDGVGGVGDGRASIRLASGVSGSGTGGGTGRNASGDGGGRQVGGGSGATARNEDLGQAEAAAAYRRRRDRRRET